MLNDGNAEKVRDSNVLLLHGNIYSKGLMFKVREEHLNLSKWNMLIFTSIQVIRLGDQVSENGYVTYFSKSQRTFNHAVIKIKS